MLRLSSLLVIALRVSETSTATAFRALRATALLVVVAVMSTRRSAFVVFMKTMYMLYVCSRVSRRCLAMSESVRSFTALLFMT